MYCCIGKPPDVLLVPDPVRPAWPPAHDEPACPATASAVTLLERVKGIEPSDVTALTQLHWLLASTPILSIQPHFFCLAILFLLWLQP